MPDVIGMTGLPESSIYALIAKDEFPRPIALGAKRVGWSLSDVQAWLYAKIEATKNETPEATRQRGCRPPKTARVQRSTKSTRADGRRSART
nr:AlpA family phage regulatory protein [Bradyrhizobium sp. G127]